MNDTAWYSTRRRRCAAAGNLINNPPMRTPRVLLVGHGSEFVQGLRATAVLEGTDLVECPTRLQALRLARRTALDVVVTDPHTTVEEDLAFVEELRLIAPAIRPIVLAPEATSAELIKALRSHVFACFTAPFDLQEVAHMIGRALEQDRWRDGIDVVSGLPHWVSLRMSAQLVTAERLVRFVTEMPTTLPEQERNALVLAFREMLVNAVEHGAGFDPDKVIEVTAARTGRAVVYHLRDPGRGFDRATLEHAAVANPPGDPVGHMDRRLEMGLRPGGFGILLTERVVDELVYSEKGNEVILIKYVDGGGRGLD
jgi:anti-sigma regulatory factor (Ser/Thr protein kinase)